ncbi:MAG: hypothetical protein D6796_00190 [Caldilineae bacterium]|nr:MAG: hypothetical protein D6796_00190 [Caldilineae bacterium]
MQAGVPVLGDPKSVQASWLGSSGSGARIGIQRATPPFRRLELAYLLESRELAPLWLLDRLRGKTDQLIVRATQRRKPEGEMEILPAGDRALKRLKGETIAPWTLSEAPHGLVIARRGASNRQVEGAMPFLEQYGAALKRLSWGPKDPHLLLVLRLSDLPEADAAPLFEAIRRLAGGEAAQ